MVTLEEEVRGGDLEIEEKYYARLWEQIKPLKCEYTPIGIKGRLNETKAQNVRLGRRSGGGVSTSGAGQGG